MQKNWVSEVLLVMPNDLSVVELGFTASSPHIQQFFYCMVGLPHSSCSVMYTCTLLKQSCCFSKVFINYNFVTVFPMLIL